MLLIDFKHLVFWNFIVISGYILLFFGYASCPESGNKENNENLFVRTTHLLADFVKITLKNKINPEQYNGIVQNCKKIRFFMYNTPQSSIEEADFLKLVELIGRAEDLLVPKKRFKGKKIENFEEIVSRIRDLGFKLLCKSITTLEPQNDIKENQDPQDTEVPLSEECCICLGNLNKMDICVLACNHIFHKICVLKWLFALENAHSACPVCREMYYEGSFGNTFMIQIKNKIFYF